jgi:titin
VPSEPPASAGGPLMVSDVLRNSMTISWQPPHSDGGSPLTGYIVEKTCDDGTWTRVDRVRPHIYSYTLTNLAPHHRYRFRVIAENAVGRSRALESRQAMEAKSPYGKWWLASW